MFSNAEILSAVVTRWAMPLCSQVMTDNLSKIPFLDNVQSKIRSTGWVNAQWCISNEITPFAEPIARAIVTPALTKAITNIPDESVPAFAHGIVDKALEKGELSIMDGNIIFDKRDLEQLKRLLNINLPVAEPCLTYNVKENEV